MQHSGSRDLLMVSNSIVEIKGQRTAVEGTKTRGGEGRRMFDELVAR